MKKTFLFLLLCCCSLYSAAQSLKLNLGEQPVYTQDKVDVTYNDINLRFIKNSAVLGASIYRNDTYFGDHFLNISSTKNIIKIEFEGKKSSVTTSTADLVVIKGDGNFELDQAGTSRWEGSAKEVRIAGASTSTAYTIVTVRIWLEGYVEGEESEDIDIIKRPGAEVHYYAQPNNLPSNGRPVTLAVVSDSKFQQTLQPYLLWKTQQGYHVEEIYADKVAQETGTSEDALAMAIRDRLMALQPQPSYVLLAGDKDQVPPFTPRTEMGGGKAAVTDYFYGEYTGDHYAEAAVGRFPANTSEQLKPMLDKTKYMSLIQPEDAGWLRNSVVVHSPSMQPDGLSTQGACDYGVSFFKKWEGNSAEVIFRASKTTEINKKLNDGCSFVTYLGHGGEQMWFDDWSMANYKVADVQNLTNKDRYPVVLALTCLSGSFQYSSYYTCMAEQFMRMENAGAVAYVGATRESMDGPDNLFFGGGNGAHQKFEHIGFLRSLFNPDKNDDESQLTRTIGDAVNIGKFASRVLNDNLFRRFSEFFTLFGDPTYQPYATVPLRMTIDAPATATAGHSVEVTTVPLAIVAISKEREVISVALADSLGKATLPIPADAPTGNCTLYSSAPNYNDLPSTISILPFDGQPEEAPAVQKPMRVQYVDVVDMESVGSILQHELTSTQPASFALKSPARYTMVAGSNMTPGRTETEFQHWNTYGTPDTPRAIYMRNAYDPCSFITMQSAGKVAYVEVDWLHPTGQTEILGVYGSTTPFTSTSQTNGTKLGELRKGDNNRLDIKGNWPYIQVRAEDYLGFFESPSVDQDDVFITSLRIGWNKLDDADVDANGKVDVDDVPALSRIIATGNSTPDGDVNCDGRVTIADMVRLVDVLKK